MKHILTLLSLAIPFLTFAQVMDIESGATVHVDGAATITLEDVSLNNDGSFDAGTSTVNITGTAAQTSSSIGGTQETTFHNLTVNKTSNDAQLDQNVNVSNTLTMTSGDLDIQTNDLTIESGGATSGGSSTSYVKTSSTGTLVQEVSSTDVNYPVGNSSYNPIIINNTGTTDNFDVRVTDEILEDGTSGTAFTSDAVDRTWMVNEETAGGSIATITVQWEASEELPGFLGAMSWITHYNNSAWDAITETAASGAGPYTQTRTGITSFSPFGVFSGSSPLPVEMLYFTGEKRGLEVLLFWETETELDNEGFEVQRSANGTDGWEVIGWVDGQGTSFANHYYDFVDESPMDGYNYYRLRQVDYSGEFKYTDIVVILFEGTGGDVTVFPNPATYYFDITPSAELEGPFQIGLFSVNGQLIESSEVNGPVRMDVTDLPAGTYIVVIANEFDQRWVKRVIINE